MLAKARSVEDWVGHDRAGSKLRLSNMSLSLTDCGDPMRDLGGVC